MRARTALECAAFVAIATVAMVAACSKPPGSQNATQNAAQNVSQNVANSAAQTAAETQPPSAATEHEEPADPSFIGRVWVSTTPGAARGSIIVFLPDRSLLMTSCFEPFRISKWGVVGDHIRWLEDTVPLEAKVTMLSKTELRLDVPGHVQTFIAASVPYKCPDMPR